MKKIITTVILMYLLGACVKKPLNINLNESLQVELNKYSDILSTSKLGWKANYIFKTKPNIIMDSSLGFFFKKEPREVIIDFLSSKRDTIEYQIHNTEKPTLSFLNYSSLFTKRADPTQNSNPFGDQDFYFDTIKADTIKLIGRKNKSVLKLVKRK